MIKITKNISTKIIIILLFFITQGFAKNLPPGSGEGDLPANVLILLDKSGSMNVSAGTSGIPTRYPYRLAVGSKTVDGGRNVFYNARWSNYIKSNISYDNKFVWKWSKTTPCTYKSTVEVAEYYDGHFYFVNNHSSGRQLCKVNETTGVVTKVKFYDASNYYFRGGDLYDKYLYLFSKASSWSKDPQIIIRDLSNGTEIECTYNQGWSTTNIGQTMSSFYWYGNGTPEINRSGSYMVAYRFDWWNANNRGFHKYNITPGVCPDQKSDDFILYDFKGAGIIKDIESASIDDDYFYLANYSKHKIQRFDLSGPTLQPSKRKEIGKNGRLSGSYSPTSDSEVKFKNPYSIAVDSTNNRIYVSDTYNNAIQVLDEESDGFEFRKVLGGQTRLTRMTGAHDAIKAITTDANLTSGVHFGFAYWSYANSVWVYWNWNKYPKCRSIKTQLMNKYGVASNHWWFAHPLYTCRDLGTPAPGYTGWDTAKKQAKPCDNYNCLKVKIDKFGAARVAKEVVKVSAGGGTDAKAFTKIALEYFKHKDSPRDDSLKCQVNYLIVIGDGVWSNHKSGLQDIKTLKDTYGVKTITVAYGGGISKSGKANFREYAKAGGTTDLIVADTASALKSSLSSELNRILAERVSFTSPALTAKLDTGASLMQAQFKYVQNEQWRGTLKKTKLNDDGSIKKDSSGDPEVEWEASAKIPDPKNRKIWSVIPGTDYTADLNNIVTTNRDDIYSMFNLFGSEIKNYHTQNPKVAATVGTTRCKSTTLFGPTTAVEDGINDDTEGLITFIRGLDYFDKDGDCNVTEIRKDSNGNKIYLGDIYHSEMIVVGKPNAESKFSSEKEEAYWRATKKYDDWANSANFKNRVEMVYVGANDGMLHAIDFKTGIEQWAFIPPFVLPKMPNIINPSLNNDKSTKNKGGSNAIYGVDGSPVQHDIFFKSPFDTAEKWHTVLIVPYGRGGNGFSALIVTDPKEPRHLFSIYNDVVGNQVHVMKHDGEMPGPYPYMAKSYTLDLTDEAITVQDAFDNDNTIDGTCNNTKATSCYKSRTFTFENFQSPAGGMKKEDFTVEINDVEDKNFTVTNTANTLVIDFLNEITFHANPDMKPSADTVGIYVNQGTTATGVQSPNAHYDYSELGETWSAPRVLRIPNKQADTDIFDDLYVAVMGAGYGARYEGVGSGVYVINLTDNDNPGKIEKFISIKDTPGNGIVSSVPGDPVVITRDAAKGYVNFAGALVYTNDLEGKITKINLTDLVEPGLKIYDHYTLFDTKSTESDGRYMYHSMEAAIGKDTKNLWLFAGTGDFENLTDTGALTSNVLLGIADDAFPEMKVPLDVQAFNSGLSKVPPTIDDIKNCLDTTKNKTSEKCPKKMGAGIASKRGWVIHLDDYKKVTASPTIAGGMAYFPIFTPPKGADKCKNGAASICAVDDECGTNYSSTLGKHVKSDECLYVGEGILSKIVTFGGKLYANIAGKADDGSDLINKDAIGMEVDITRGTWKESF